VADSIGFTLDTSGLDRLEKLFPGKVDAILGKLANDTAKKATSLMTGGRRGRYYVINQGGMKIRHRASAPGEPPGVVTGRLKNSIKAVRIRHLQWEVRVEEPHGKHLEFGTARMKARPFLRPAVFSVAKAMPPQLLEAFK